MNTKWRYFDDDGVPTFYHEGIETNADNVVDALNAVEEQLAGMDAKLSGRDEMIAKMIEVGNRLEQFAGYAGLPHADYAVADWHLILRKIDEEKE